MLNAIIFVILVTTFIYSVKHYAKKLAYGYCGNKECKQNARARDKNDSDIFGT